MYRFLFATLGLMLIGISVYIYFIFTELEGNRADGSSMQMVDDTNESTSAPQYTLRPSIFRGYYLTSSTHFSFSIHESAKEHLSHIERVLEDAYMRLSPLFGVTFDRRVRVFIHQDYESFNRALGIRVPDEFAPYHVAGVFRSQGIRAGIHMTPPNQYVLGFSYEKGLVHELIHALANEITPSQHLDSKNLFWLIEGLATYKADMMDFEAFQSILITSVRNNTIPSLNDLEAFNCFDQFLEVFHSNRGYIYGASIIAFINATYGFDKVLELYRNPNDYMGVFGFDRNEFERQWRQFLVQNYG